MDSLEFTGETTKYEKKLEVERNKPKSWLKTVSAFANTEGGKIFFGISDDNEFVGLENPKEDMDFISETVKAKMEPIPHIKLDSVNYLGKDFIVLTVSEGEQNPYFLIENGARIAYKRVGNESVVVNNVELNNLVLKGMNKTFDSLVTSIPRERASFSKLKAVYYLKTGKDFAESDFFSFGLVNSDNYLTNAGALFADERLVYQSRIFATRWKGKDKSNSRFEALDDKEFEGSLLYLLQSGEEFIKANSKKMWRKGDKYRIEYPEYPERAVQEALVNALIHRDYTQIGSEIHIDMYDDRLEIYSPGGMFDGSLIQEKNPYSISSKRRNPIIADLFSRMNLMERRGSGLKKILDYYSMQENYNSDLKPVFNSTNDSFFIILKNLNYGIDIDSLLNNQKTTDEDSEVATNSQEPSLEIEKPEISVQGAALETKKAAIKLTSQEEKIIFLAMNLGEFKSTDIQKILNIKKTRAKEILSNMIAKGLLIYEGDNRYRKYKIKK